MSQNTLQITKHTLAKACAGALLTAASLLGTAGDASAQVLVKNNGAIFAIKPGATVIVKTGSVDNSGLVDNGGTLIIEGDFINQDTANAGGAIGKYRVQEDWVNNGRYQADQGEVELYGANQSITGTNPTSFYDLNLTGTGIKTQTLDATTTHVLSLNDRELATATFKMFVTNTATTAITRTTGFVSSLGAGRLSRNMANNALYLYPTGSSVGTARYRPIEVTPSTANAQTLEVRLANVDATTEGFDRSIREADFCEINPDFYHLIGRSGGATDAVALSIYFNPTADGVYKEVAHWQNVPQWENIGPVTTGTGGGLSRLTVPSWSIFSPEAFALANDNPSIDPLLTQITDVTCFGGNNGAIDITVNNGTDLTFTYSPSGGAGPDANNLTAGNYTLVVTDTATGCNRGAVPYTFTVNQTPDINIDSTVVDVTCNGLNNGMIEIDVTNVTGGIQSITWTGTTQTGDSIGGLDEGTYIATVNYNGSQCSKSDTFQIAQPDAIDVNPTIVGATCNGLSTGSIDLTVSGGNGGFQYVWSSSAQDTTDNLTNIPAGSYSVTVTDASNCSDTLSGLVVTQPDVLTLVASNDTTIPLDYSADLEVISTTGGTGTVSYEWTPGETLSNPTGSTTTATPTETTSYLVTGTDANGCTAVDTVLVTVDFNLVAIPDGFTPNGDGANDVFTFHYSPAIDLVELKIFNRWGQLLYEANNWDGTYKDKKQPMDTYIYQAVFQMPDGSTVNYAGDFLLIR